MSEVAQNWKRYKQLLIFSLGVLTGLLIFGVYMQTGMPSSNSYDIIEIRVSTTATTNTTTVRTPGPRCTPAYVQLIGSNVTSNSEGFFQDLEMKDRLEYVQKQCKNSTRWMKTTTTEVHGQQMFIVDSNQSVIICDLHKVGSHQLAGILQHVNNLTGNLFEYRDKILTHLNAKQANKSPYKKVMFIRDPMERLLSAYINDRAVRHMNQSKVSFQTFLQDILETPVEKLDLHHQRFHDICQPCKIQYQVIGTLPTFHRDIPLVFNGAEFNRTDHLHGNLRVGRNYLESYFKNVSQSVTHKIWELYRIDYFLFGFPYPKHLMDVSLIPIFAT